jgi:hypothetical protein
LPLSKPENIRANAGNAKVTVTWDPVADADHYLLHCYWMERLTVGEGTIEVSGSSTQQIVDSVKWTVGPTADDTNIQGTTTAPTNGRTYYFWIYALTASNVPGNSSFMVSATASANQPPAAPIITNVEAGDGYVNLYWNPPATFTGSVIPILNQSAIFVGFVVG